jgi:hypothetical protein
MFVNNTPNAHPLAHLAQNLSQQLGGAIDPQSIMMLLRLVRSMRQNQGQAQGGLPQGGLPQAAGGCGAPQVGLPQAGFPAGGAAGLCQGMSAGQRQQMHQLRRLLGPNFKPLFKQAMCGQLDPAQAGQVGPQGLCKPVCAPGTQVNTQANSNVQNGLINVNNQININNQIIQGEEKGGWLAKHGGYKKLKDGSMEITAGKYKGCTAVPTGQGTYNVMGPNGQQQGVYKAPGGKDKIASPLTFDLNGDGQVSTTGVKDGKQFDINGDGKLDQTAWAGKGDGVLAFDGNGNGKAGEDGKELLGNNSDVNGDGKADGHANGFEALKALATRHLGFGAVQDGKLDQWELKQLEQKTGLGMLVDGQKKGLAELGISQVNLGYQEAGKNADGNGNEHRQVGAGFVRNGQVGKVNDVWFQYQ